MACLRDNWQGKRSWGSELEIREFRHVDNRLAYRKRIFSDWSIFFVVMHHVNPKTGTKQRYFKEIIV